ncbi:PAS domain-containing sensor histidine kinase [Janthinobacterium fluminis]|uniref:PAS domain S-box protein n=1 Tax=Janthinobacterium fluminis TaxID=2987524 RepID=A0ABT5K5G9_9BURK|nr:PAS domain S-box protein [Janthinobacterium fluminis]MDC8760139.1 PAS domain S-box protein [Janthinobacterium fluminis]
MRKWSVESWSLAGVAAILVLLSALGALTCREMMQARTAATAVDTAHERLIQLEQRRSGYLRAGGAAAAEAGIDALIGAEQAVLARAKLAAAQQNTRERMALGALLVTMLALLSFILLRVRSLTLSRQSTHAQLQGSEARYREIVDTMQEGIWITDAGGRIVFANRRMTELIGCALPDLIGQPVNAFMPEVALQCCCPLYRGGDVSPRDQQYQRADGKTAWALVAGRLRCDADGAVCGALVMMTDITERKLAEQALGIAHTELENRIRLRTAELVDANLLLRDEIDEREAAQRALAHSEKRLQEIISMMPLALFLKDAESRIVLMNEACEQQWGMRFADLQGKGGHGFFPPEQMDGFLADDRAAFASGRLQVGEELVWNALLQESRLVQCYKKPLYDDAGQPMLLIAMSVDITNRKRDEEALQQSLLQLRELSDHQQTIKEEERKRIALDIHDDLGQNLMALKIDVSMLHARTGGTHPRLNQQVGRALETIDTTIKSVRAIINDLHPSTLELGLCAAVEWLLKQFERRSAIRYELFILDDSANATLDNRQTAAIFRVIQESLANILRHAAASAVEVSLNLNAQWVTIVIADNGIGIQPGDHGKAASYGLKSITERISALGGELVIDSRKDSGTALTILMPVVATAAPPPGAPRLSQAG